MDTPSLSQDTSAQVQLVPQFGMDGGPVLLVLIKQRFQVTRRGVASPVDGAAIQLADLPWDEDAPETSSIRVPADLCLAKPSTDVLVSGAAVAPGRTGQKTLDVSVRVGPVQSQVRVFGRRVWYRGLTGLAPSDPLPFEELPLLWENAFGGFDAVEGQKPLEEARNPIGRGLARDPESLVDTEAPAIEDPGDLIRTHRSRPAPAGLGPLGRHWMPRRQYVGTVDDRWMRERMPLLPLDFDSRHNQAAPPALIAPEPFRGGEGVELLNLCEDGPLRFRLPRWVFHVGIVNREGAVVEHRPMMDTVFLEPNTRHLTLTWRSAVAWPSIKDSIRSVRVHQKEFR